MIKGGLGDMCTHGAGEGKQQRWKEREMNVSVLYEWRGSMSSLCGCNDDETRKGREGRL